MTIPPDAETADARVERAELARVLLLLTAGLTLLAMFGEVLLMGSLWYAAVPVTKATLLMVLAHQVKTLRRWAMITTIVLSAMALTGFGVSLLIGLLPQVERTVTLTGLFTEVAAPVTLIVLSARLLAATPRRRPAAVL